MDTDDYTQPLEAVMRHERSHVYTVPLKVADRRYLFEEWCKKNPKGASRNRADGACNRHARSARVH